MHEEGGPAGLVIYGHMSHSTPRGEDGLFARLRVTVRRRRSGLRESLLDGQIGTPCCGEAGVAVW